MTTLRLFALGLAGLSLAATTARASSTLNFVDCPYMRDTGSVPCWLIDHDGKTYYLGIQTDTLGIFHPPSLGQKAVIEGTLSAEPRVCGSLVLKDVHSGPIGNQGECPSVILPSEDRFQLPFMPPRPPGPNIGKKFRAPNSAADFLRPTKAEPPFVRKVFTISFEFNGSSFWFDDQRILLEAIDYARASHARSIKVTGHWTKLSLDDGSTLSEMPEIARIRAKMTAGQLESGDLPAPVEASWRLLPDHGGANARLVEIEIQP